MKITCSMEEVDEKIAELMDTLEDIDELAVETGEESRIVAYSYKVLFPSLGLYAREGAMLAYDADEQDWYPDFSLTLLYNRENEQLYWGQDGIEVSLYNFLNATNQAKSMEELSALDCVIEVDDTED